MTTDMPALEVASRLDRLRQSLDGAEVDAIIVTTLANVRYLTGFSGSAGVVVVSEKDTLLTTDGRYRTQSAEQLAAAGVDALVTITIGDAQSQRDAVAAAVGSAGGRIGLEADNVTWSSQRRWAELLEQAGSLVPTTGVVEALRQVKDDGEIARMGRAAAIADAALARGAPALRGGGDEDAHRARVRAGARHGHAPGRGRGPGLRHDRGRRAQLGQAAPPADGAAHPRG